MREQSEYRCHLAACACAQCVWRHHARYRQAHQAERRQVELDAVRLGRQQGARVRVVRAQDQARGGDAVPGDHERIVTRCGERGDQILYEAFAAEPVAQRRARRLLVQGWNIPGRRRW